MIDNIPTTRLVGTRASARYVDDRGRAFCAIHHCRSEYAIVSRCKKSVSVNGMTFLGTIVRYSKGGGYEHGCYWTALSGHQRGPYRNVKAALAAFVLALRNKLISGAQTDRRARKGLT